LTAAGSGALKYARLGRKLKKTHDGWGFRSAPSSRRRDDRQALGGRVTIQRWAATRLERGSDARPLLELSAMWRAVADPVRPVRLPHSAAVIGIGGATLGGSGKTPVTLTLAIALAGQGLSPAVVASGYRARVDGVHRVLPRDDVRLVGDEALWLARALWPCAVPVVVGRRRTETIAYAATLSPLVLVDSLLQTSPEKLALSLLVLDGSAPWGAGSCPPAGDLRADRARLLAAADLVLLSTPADERAARELKGAHLLSWSGRLRGARTPTGKLVGLEQLRARRVGLAAAVARPNRLLTTLAEHGIEPALVRLASDHARPDFGAVAAADPPVDLWLTTAKCATKLGQKRPAAPVWVLQHEAVVPRELVARILDLSPRRPVVECAPCCVRS
jgi:tetraacyldisaccharide 4'-kinase